MLDRDGAHTKLDQGEWHPSSRDLQSARLQTISMMMKAYALIRTDVPLAEMEQVAVDIPVADRGKIAVAQAQAWRWKETKLRPAEELKELEEMIERARSMGMGFGQGSSESDGVTRILCILLKDASVDIRVKAANAMINWAEPIALSHLEQVWNGASNKKHLLKLRNTPDFDGLAARNAIADILKRNLQIPVSKGIREIVDMRI